MDTKDKLIEKLKEIFKYLNDRANTVTLNWSYYVDLRNEITALEKQVEEQESKPIYDEAYLNECIAKAMPNLSKIKDVDKELAEIRGIEEQESIKHETCDGCAMFQDCGCMLDDSCPQCFEYSMWTAIDVEEQESISDEEADDTLLGLDGEETWLP